MAQPLIARLQGVAVHRRGRIILGPLDLSVHHGELWGVVGPNGAGKSTLLRLLAGLERSFTGEASVFGEPVCTRPGDSRCRVGLLFQHHEFHAEVPFTVEDVVGFGRAARVVLGSLRRRTDLEAREQALAALGLTSLRHRLYRELSGGERQKVQLARLLAQEPRMVLLDEPAAGLDPDWRERLITLVEDLHRRTRAAVLLVTHQVDHLPRSCRRVLLLQRGRVLAIGPPAEVLTPPLLSRLYSCEMAVSEHRGRYLAHSVGTVLNDGSESRQGW